MTESGYQQSGAEQPTTIVNSFNKRSRDMLHPKLDYSGLARFGLGIFLIVTLVASPLSVRAQELAQNPAQQTVSGSAFPAAAQTRASSAPALQNVTWRELPRDFLRDQKEIWLFPKSLAKGHHWLPVLFVVGGTAALIAADPHVMPHFRQTTAFDNFNNAFSATNSGAYIAAVPAAFYVGSLLRKSKYGQSTSLLAGEAVADDAVLMLVMKAITRRARPYSIPTTGKYGDTFFKDSSYGSSFPSGHALMSFSVATVFARRYRRHRWVPYVAYGLAGVISFSRITTGAHFPSDVFFGAGAGFAIARYVALQGN